MSSEDFAPPVSVTAMVDTNDPHAMGALASGGALQRMTDGKYATAVAIQKPRNLPDIERSVLAEATMLGEDAFYGWGAGKDRIQGPSVKLAMATARIWGNCAVTTEPVQDLGDSWVFTSAFVDLETGFTLTRQFRQSKKSAVYGKHDDERKDDIRFQVGQSKAARNCVLNALPEWLIDRAMIAAKDGVRKRVELYINSNGIEKARQMALASLAKSGIKEDRVLAKFGREAVAGLTIEDLVGIKGDMKAIDDGAESPASLYPDGDAKAATPDAIRAALSTPPDKAAEPVEAEVKPKHPTDARAKVMGEIAAASHTLCDGEFAETLSELGLAEDELASLTTISNLKKLLAAMQRKQLAATQAAKCPTDGAEAAT